MPAYPNRQFLDFEQPIKDLYEQIDATIKLAEKNPKIDLTATVKQLEQTIVDKRKAITESLSPWQRVQLSRHPDRPYTLKSFMEANPVGNFVLIVCKRIYQLGVMLFTQVKLTLVKEISLKVLLPVKQKAFLWLF